MKYTSLKQSKNLLKSGMKAETADMVYYSEDGISFSKRPILIPWSHCINKDDYYPCWSCEALIEWLSYPIIKCYESGSALVWDCTSIADKNGTLVTSAPSMTLFEAIYDTVYKVLYKYYLTQ